MALDEMIADVETEYGFERGIDLGSIYDDASRDGAEDRSEYRAEIASAVEADPAWEIVCHSMVSSGAPVRRYYLARRRPMTKADETMSQIVIGSYVQTLGGDGRVTDMDGGVVSYLLDDGHTGTSPVEFVTLDNRYAHPDEVQS